MTRESLNVDAPVEWRLDKIKFTDCIAHSDRGEEVSAVDKVAGISDLLYQN